MKEKEDFLKNRFIFGLVIKASLEDINSIKEHIVNNTDSRIIYQKISTNKLRIKEIDGNEGVKNDKNRNDRY